MTRPNDITKDFREFVELLNSHSVDYIIVGAWAVAFHGEPRTTGDMDVFVRPTPENAKRVKAVLDEFGFGSVGLTADDFCVMDQVVQLGYEPSRIDILTSITGVTFDEAWSSRQSIVVDDLSYVFLGEKELIRNKLAAGRDKDLEDVKRLEKFAKQRKSVTKK